jgi:hypothetical protein
MWDRSSDYAWIGNLNGGFGAPQFFVLKTWNFELADDDGI